MEQLEGGEWQLEGYGPAGAPEPAVSERPATLRFDGGRLAGFTGCNRIAGPYQADDATITFGPLIATRAACVDEARSRQERAILIGLQGQVTYRIADGRLTITSDERRQELTYRAAEETA